MMKTPNKPALFLDRDGVINIDFGYVHKIENFQFIDGIFDLVKRANMLGYLVVVVTNQSGIGRGYYSEEDFWRLTDWMCQKFQDNGCEINAVYFSPFHPIYGVGKYLTESNLRKPRPGMILKAARDLGINLNSSVLVGDNFSDISAAISSGISNSYLYQNAEPFDGAINISHLSEVKLEPYLSLKQS